MSSTTDYLLSPEQREAVYSDAPAILVVASAGSGKTEVVARRIERLWRESTGKPFRVLALSHTIGAVKVLDDRIRERLGVEHSRVHCQTIHDFAHSLLCQHGTKIGLPVDIGVLSRDMDRAEVLERHLVDEGRPVPKDLHATLHHLDLARAREEPSPLAREWHETLALTGAVDYGSMLTGAEELLQFASIRKLLARLYKHVIVDEAQNLTTAQYSLLASLIGPPPDEGGDHIKTMIVGDHKAPTAGLGGADPLLMRRFEKEYNATCYELTRNFRSARLIASLGGTVSRALGQLGSDLSSTIYAAQGTVMVTEAANEATEGDFVANWALGMMADGMPEQFLVPGESASIQAESIAVLGRSAGCLSATETAFRKAGHKPACSSAANAWLASTIGKVAFEVACFRSVAHHRSARRRLTRLLGTDEREMQTLEELASVLERQEDHALRQLAGLVPIEDPASYMKHLSGLDPGSETPEDELAAWEADADLLMRSWSSFQQETGVSAQVWINFATFVARRQWFVDTSPGIRLQTIHQARGREYRAVAVVGLNQGQLPHHRATSQEEQTAELQDFHVAVTRARRVLLLTRARTRRTRHGEITTEPSCFLKLVPAGDRET